MKKWTFVIAFALLVSVAAFAQQDVTKVGVIDTSRVYQAYFRTTTGIRNYEAKRAEFQAEVDSRTAELKTLQQKKLDYEKNGKETEALKIEAEIISKTDFLTEYTRVKQIELESLKQKLVDSDDFYDTLYGVIEDVAESEGLSIILSLQQANAILWYSPSVDITDKVIERLSKL
ncbi:MAG: OmpH family outer membrane protein [Treponemataceae bacterium]|nr:OmpH family outer membrane protein [Treponemataceae bacterium]